MEFPDLSCILRHGRAASLLLSAALVACGGGHLQNVDGSASAGSGGTPDSGNGGSSPPVTPPASVVTGVAAAGAPLRGVPVVLKDRSNRSVTAVTGADGTFTLDTTQLSPPFLLQAVAPDGGKLLSVSTDTNVTATINITPLTDAVVRAWYGVQDRSADAAFADPGTAPLPAPGHVRAAAGVVQRGLLLAIRAYGAPVFDPPDLIARPFAADSNGMDKLLDDTRVSLRSGAIEFVGSAGVATQTVTLALDPAAGTITATSTAVNGSATTSSLARDFLPVDAAQLAAIDQVWLRLATLTALVNTTGYAFTDLQDAFTADMMLAGLGRTEYLDQLQRTLQGVQQPVFSIGHVLAVDAAAGRADVELRLAFIAGSGLQVERFESTLVRGADGAWRIAGDGRIAELRVVASTQSELLHQPQVFMQVDYWLDLSVRVPAGFLPDGVSPMEDKTSTVEVAGPFGSRVLTPGYPERGYYVTVQPFSVRLGPLAAPLPPAGTPLRFTIRRRDGSSVSYTVPLRGVTMEVVGFTHPIADTVATRVVSLAWPAPTTFPLELVALDSFWNFPPQSHSGPNCSAALNVTPPGTSAILRLPDSCPASNGVPTSALMFLKALGPNGETSSAAEDVPRNP